MFVFPFHIHSSSQFILSHNLGSRILILAYRNQQIDLGLCKRRRITHLGQTKRIHVLDDSYLGRKRFRLLEKGWLDYDRIYDTTVYTV